MPDLLLIGGATDKMLERMADKFTIHKLAGSGYPADQITHVCTNGHDGIKPDIMASLPNLKHSSCYGVGYDAIDTTEVNKASIDVFDIDCCDWMMAKDDDSHKQPVDC